MTGSRLHPATLLRPTAFWLAVGALPLLVNMMVWGVFVVPQRRQLSAWQEAQALITLKPKLASLVTDSHRLAMEWDRTAFRADDPSAVMQRIQRLAGQHGVQIKEISTQGEEGQATGHERTVAGFSTLPLDLEVSGSFSKIARWMNAVESQSCLQIDAWILAPEKDAGQASRLSVNLTAFLRAT